MGFGLHIHNGPFHSPLPPPLPSLFGCRLGTRGFLSPAVALDDLCYSLLRISLAEAFALLSLDTLPPLPHDSVAHSLDSSSTSGHPPLPAGREPAGVWLGKERG
jgi:hypothetical protein